MNKWSVYSLIWLAASMILLTIMIVRNQWRPIDIAVSVLCVIVGVLSSAMFLTEKAS